MWLLFCLQKIVTNNLLQYSTSTDERLESCSTADSLICIIFVLVKLAQQMQCKAKPYRKQAVVKPVQDQVA